MSEFDRFDQAILDWFADASPRDVPRRVVDAATAEARRTRRARPLPDFITRWLPMSTTFDAVRPRPLSPPRSTARLGAVGILIALALLALALIGAALLSVGTSPAPPAVRNGVITFGSSGDLWTVRPDGSDRRSLTTDPGVEVHAIWSPDGTRVAYWQLASSDARVASLMVMDADGSHRAVLADGVGLTADGPAPVSWSPDGTQLTYGDARSRTSDVYVVAVDGGTPTRIATPGDLPVWSPDGSLIAYRIAAGRSTDKGVYVVTPQGTGTQRVSQAGGSGEAFIGITFSPDGSRLAYLSGPDGMHRLQVGRVDGSGETTLPNTGDIYYPQWSPLGDRIVISRTDPGPSWHGLDFVLVDPETGAEADLDHPPVFAWATWSPDGTRLLGKVVTDVAPYASDEVIEVDATGVEDVVHIVALVGTGMPTWQRLGP